MTYIPVGAIWRGHGRNNRDVYLRMLEASETHLLMQTQSGKRVWTSVRHVVAHFTACGAEAAAEAPEFPIETSPRPAKPGPVNRSGRPIDMFAMVKDGAIVGFGESFSSGPIAPNAPTVEAETAAPEVTRTPEETAEGRHLPGLDLEEFFSKETTAEFFLAYDAHRDRVLALGADIDVPAFAQWLFLNGLSEALASAKSNTR